MFLLPLCLLFYVTAAVFNESVVAAPTVKSCGNAGVTAASRTYSHSVTAEAALQLQVVPQCYC